MSQSQPSGEALPAYKYWAFISYSQKDERWAKRLHESLETYVLPKELVGQDTPPWGPLPKRLTPVFRDRDELSSAADLGEKLTGSLHLSRALVVLCSPNAAQSRWVNEEIKRFKSHGREDRVFAIVVEGEPNGSDRAETAAAECFPQALRYRVDDKGDLTTARVEPIAGDARKDKDGFERAMLKTVAGILGVDFAKLAKREEERRARRNRIVFAALVTILAIVSSLGVWGWIEQSRASTEAVRAQRQAASASVGNLIGEDPLKATLVLLGLRGGPDPDGALQAAVQLDSTPIPKAVLRSKEGTLLNAGFTRDGAQVLTISDSGMAQLWKADGTGEPVLLKQVEPKAPGNRCGPGDAPRPRALPDKQNVCAMNAKHVATAAGDGREVFIWNAEGKGEPVKLAGHAAPVISASFSPDGERIATTSQDATAAVWPVDGRAAPWVLRGHTAWVTKAAFSPDGLWVLTTTHSVDGAVRIWPSSDWQGPPLLSGHVQGTQSAAFSPDGQRIVTLAGDGTVRVWNADGHGEPVALHGPPGISGRAASFSPDGRRVVAPFADGTAWIWNADGSGEPVVLKGDAGHVVYSAVFSPDGQTVVTASSRGPLRVWKTVGGEPVAVLKGHANGAFSAVFSADGKHIVSASNDGTARVWNADGTGSAVVLRGAPGSIFYRAAFSPDGRRVVAGSQDALARIWNADGTGEPIVLKGHSGWVFDAAFSPDGKRVVTASSDGSARVWDANSGANLVALTGHTARVSSAEFSPDGRRVLTSSVDGTARLWDLVANRQLALLKTHTNWVNQAKLSPDGKRVVTASEDGTARVWLIDWESLLERLAQRTTACLAPADRERYLGQTRQLANEAFEQCERKFGRVASDAKPR